MGDADALRELFGELLADAIEQGRRKGGHLYFASVFDARDRDNGKTAPPVPADSAVVVADCDGADYPFALDIRVRSGRRDAMAHHLTAAAYATAARIGAAHPGGGADARVAFRASGSRVTICLRFVPRGSDPAPATGTGAGRGAGEAPVG